MISPESKARSKAKMSENKCSGGSTADSQKPHNNKIALETA